MIVDFEAAAKMVGMFCGLPLGLVIALGWYWSKTQSFKAVWVTTLISFIIFISAGLAFVGYFLYPILALVAGIPANIAGDYSLGGPIGNILTGIWGGLSWTIGNVFILGWAWRHKNVKKE